MKNSKNNKTRNYTIYLLPSKINNKSQIFLFIF